MEGRIHSTESFGTVDGPGIRFVVFVQGCPMRCQYCHNPDTWTVEGGTMRTVDELLAEFEHNRDFYRDGGLTVTGGEPLLQLDFVTELFEAAKKRGIHTCLDTSGITFDPQNAPRVEKMKRLMASTDLVMLDIKHIDPEEHIKLTQQKNDGILAFAHFVDDLGISIWIRHVVVPGITYNEEYLKRLGRFIATLHHLQALDVLPYHTMGIVKYEQLGMDYPLKGVPQLDKKDAVHAKEVILNAFHAERKRLQGKQ